MHAEIATAVLVPGWAARRRRPVLAIALAVAGIAVPLILGLYIVLTGRSRVALSLDSTFLGLVMVVGVGAIGARVAALFEVWAAAGRPRALSRPELVACGVALVGLVATSVVVVEVGRARASIAPAFTPVGDEVLYDAREPVTAGSAPVEGAAAVPPDMTGGTGPGSIPSTTGPSGSAPESPAGDVFGPTTTTSTLPPPLPERPDSGVAADTLADVKTVLLIGGDSGPDRQGLRTDAMMLFSLHQPTGRASLVSIPRDLRRLLFPPGSALEQQHPYGYYRIANAVYADVSSHQNLRSAYAVEGVRPGVVALAQAVGYSLDVTIHDYVLVDMQGFADLVDALGGVTVRLSKSIPMPGNVPGARSQYPDTIGPGVVDMDGSTALGYARSRYGDNDYYRARRQRDLLASLAQQISIGDVALSFGAVAGAIGGTLRTSLTPDELAETLSVIGSQTAIVESVGLVPPLVNVGRPDLDEMAKIVGAVQVALVTGRPSGY